MQTSAVSVSYNELAGSMKDVGIDRVRLIVIDDIPNDVRWDPDAQFQQPVEQSDQLMGAGWTTGELGCNAPAAFLLDFAFPEVKMMAHLDVELVVVELHGADDLLG